MGNQAILLGGLEYSYMQKFALYLTSKLPQGVRVGILDDGNLENLEMDETIWMGSAKFIQEIRHMNGDAVTVILGDEPTDDEIVCRYQSCERVYQEIVRRCEPLQGGLTGIAAGGNQRWIVMTGDVAAAEVVAFSVSYAQLLGARASVLYLILSECSGFGQLFELENGSDLREVLVALRQSQTIPADGFIRNLEQMDYIAPPGNPMILHEIRPDDVLRLMGWIRRETRYDNVILVLGSSCCGCEHFIQGADEILHLTKPGKLHSLARENWIAFLKLCSADEKQELEKLRIVTLPDIGVSETGVHLIFQWQQDLVGKLAKEYVDAKWKQEGADAKW